MKSPITTHILDTAAGRPAVGVSVELEFLNEGRWDAVGRGETDGDGRVLDLVQVSDLREGSYRLHFDTEAYQSAVEGGGFFPVVTITFRVSDRNQHYHVPLLLSPFGYSTYRGS